MGASVTGEAVVAFLDGLAEVLTEFGAENDQHRRRLFSLEADVQAFRRLVGTAPAEVTP
jgi:cell division septum initiation protein DivIVA